MCRCQTVSTTPLNNFWIDLYTPGEEAARFFSTPSFRQASLFFFSFDRLPHHVQIDPAACYVPHRAGLSGLGACELSRDLSRHAKGRYSRAAAAAAANRNSMVRLHLFV